MARVNERLIRKLKGAPPASGNHVEWDDEVTGFGVRITAAGAISFVLRYVIRGRERRYTIGRYPDLSASAARDDAIKLRGRVAHGEDPLAEREKAHSGPTIADLCDRYLNEHVDHKNKPATAKEFRRLVGRQIKPALGRLRIDAISRADVAKLHNDMRTTPRQANQTLAVLSKMLQLAEAWDLRPDGTNPCRLIQRYKENKRERFLSDTELSRLGAALDAAENDGSELTSALSAIRLLALTGCRVSEVLGLRWRDIDTAQHVISIGDAKAGARSHPVGAQTLAYLEALPRKDGCEWLFPRPNGEAPLSIWMLEAAWGRIRTKAGLQDARLHDLRHTVGTYAGQTGANAFLVRDKLGHKTLAMTSRYVNRDADPLRALSDKVEARISAALAPKGSGAKLVKLQGA